VNHEPGQIGLELPLSLWEVRQIEVVTRQCAHSPARRMHSGGSRNVAADQPSGSGNPSERFCLIGSVIHFRHFAIGRVRA
jgi:hypothetical protein